MLFPFLIPFIPFPAAQVYKDNPPCNTLYVGNLSSSVNEAEVQQLFNA